jgi:glycogen debranching enzyme
MKECVFLSNKAGGYFALDGIDFSAYQGLFHFLQGEWELYKTIDNLKPIGATGQSKIFMQDGFFERHTDHIVEKFFYSRNALIYEVEGAKDVLLSLDFRRIHDFDDKGRIYSVTKEKDVLIIEYEKYEDDSLKKLNETKYLAIKGISSYSHIGDWVRRDYEYDKSRGSKSEFYVYRALSFTPINEQVVFGFGETKREAITHSSRKVEIPADNILLNTEIASNALRNLMVDIKYKDKDVMGIFAGLPWFYQFWGRDECISLIGPITKGQYMFAKHVMMRLIDGLDNDGCLHNRWPESELKSADSTLWLFKRIHQLILILEKERRTKEFFSRRELNRIYEKLTIYAAHTQKLLNAYTGLVINGPKETWMDTTDRDGKDTRSGARVEIQALTIALYDFAEYLRNLLKKEKMIDFLKLRDNLIDNTRRFLFRDSMLWDGYDNEALDRTIRPNVFLAYSAYANLLFKEEWVAIFKKTIDACWLDFGGFSTIDKNSPLMRWVYTGMNNESYHRGDSWFFINNIAATCMHQLDDLTFMDYIKKIRNASVTEMNTMGFIGQCAELSSAKELCSRGCLAQAWSAATLMELLHELGEE